MSLDFLFRTDEFNSLVRAVASGERGFSVRGLTDPARPYLLACLATRTDRPIVFVRPSSAPLAPFEAECRFFLGQLASTLRLASLPALSENPYFEVPPALEAVSSRMRFLHGLLRKPPAVVVTGLAGLLKPLPSPADLRRSFLELERGAAADRDEVLETLARFGYAREDLIASPGEYAWRGGIIDVFSPWEANPFRVELSGPEVASLREFDITSQRSLKKLERLTVPGLREFPADREFLDAWAAAARRRAKGTGRDLDAKIAALGRGEFTPGYSSLALLAKDRFVPFTDHLPDAVYIVDRPEEVDQGW